MPSDTMNLSIEHLREYADVFYELIKDDIIHVKHKKKITEKLAKLIDHIDNGEYDKIFKEGSDILEFFEN